MKKQERILNNLTPIIWFFSYEKLNLTFYRQTTDDFIEN